MVFIGFQKIFEKFQKFVILPPKNGNFTRFSRRFFGTQSSTEKASTPPPDASNDFIFGKNVP